MAAVNYHYQVQEDTSSITSATWAAPSNPCEIPAADLSASTKYLIIARGAMIGADINDDYGMRISTADDTNIATRSEMRFQPSYAGSGLGRFAKSFFFVGDFTTAASPSKVEFQAVSHDTTLGLPATMSLLLIDLDDLGSGNYVGVWDNSSDPLGTTSWGTNINGINSAVLSGDTEYLVLGYTQVDVLDNKSNVHLRLFGDSNGNGTQDQLTYATEEGEISDELRNYGFMGRVLTETTPADWIYLQAYADATGDFTKLYSYIIAIDTAAFGDSGLTYSFSATGSTVGSTPVTLASLTPSSSTNPHLYLGRWNQTTAGNEGRAYSYIYPTNDTVDQTQSLGSTEEPVYGGTGTLEATGQSIQAGTTQTIYAVRFAGVQNGTVTDGLQAKIYTGSMGGTLIATSQVLEGNKLVGNPDTWLDFIFPGGVSVSSGTTYYVSIERTGSRDTSNYMGIYYAFSNPYAGGTKYGRASGSWSSESANDLKFYFPVTFTELLYEEDVTTQQHPWDPADGQESNHMGVEVLSGDTIDMTAYRHTSDSDQTSEYEFLAVLSLELAPTGTLYDETGRTFTITSTVATTQAYTATETGRSFTITESQTLTDQMDMDELALATTVTSTVTVTDAYNSAETFSETITSTITTTDILTFNDNLSETITSTITSTDQSDMDDLALATTITSTVTTTDAYSSAEVLSETVTSTVSSTDTLNGTDDVAFTITSTITTTDDFAFGEALSFTITSTVSFTEALTLLETLSETITSTIATTDTSAMLESLAETITSTITTTDSHGFYDTGLAFTVTSTIAHTEQMDMVETLAFTVTSTDTLTDTTDMDELVLATTITSTVTSTDVYTPVGGTNYDETGRTFTITSTVSSTDGQPWDETGLTFTITSTVELWDRVEMWEAAAEAYGHFRAHEGQSNSYLYWDDWTSQYSTPDAVSETLEIRLEFMVTGGNGSGARLISNSATATDYSYYIDLTTGATSSTVTFTWSETGSALDKSLTSGSFPAVNGDRVQLRMVVTPNDGGTQSAMTTYYKIGSADDIDSATGWTTVDTATGSVTTGINKQTSDVATLGRDDYGGTPNIGARWYQWYYNGPTGGPITVDWRTWPPVRDNTWYFSDSSGGDWTINPYTGHATKTQRYQGNHPNNELSFTVTSTVVSTDSLTLTEDSAFTITATVTSTDTLVVVYDETGRQIDITSTVTLTDQFDMVESLSETVNSTVTSSDVHSTSDALTVVLTSTVSLSELLTLDELAQAINISSTIGSTDRADYVDLSEFTIVSTIDETDRSDMVEPVDSFTIISLVSAFDTYYPVGWTPPERGEHVLRNVRFPTPGVRTTGRINRG